MAWNKQQKTFTDTDLVTYRNWKPARLIAKEKRGRKYYFLLSWDNLTVEGKSFQRWVKAEDCTLYKPKSKKELTKKALSKYGKTELSWWQKIIINIQDWWYDKR